MLLRVPGPQHVGEPQVQPQESDEVEADENRRRLKHRARELHAHFHGWTAEGDQSKGKVQEAQAAAVVQARGTMVRGDQQGLR